MDLSVEVSGVAQPGRVMIRLYANIKGISQGPGMPGPGCILPVLTTVTHQLIAARKVFNWRTPDMHQTAEREQ